MADAGRGRADPGEPAGEGRPRRAGIPDQVGFAVAVAALVPVEDAGHPVLQLPGMAVDGVAGLRTEVHGVKERREFGGDDVPELPHSRVHQLTHDPHGFLRVAVEEVLHDQHRVMDLTLELDLFLVREHVIEQARVVRGRVLHRHDRAQAVGASRGIAVRQPRQAHRQVGAERPAAHLDVVDGLGDAVLCLITQLSSHTQLSVISVMARRNTRRPGSSIGPAGNGMPSTGRPM